MIDSAGAAALVAHVTFWALLAYGFIAGELGRAGVILFVVLWMVGWLGLPRVPYEPAHAMFPSYVAVLDIALVFLIAKGDVRLT